MQTAFYYCEHCKRQIIFVDGWQDPLIFQYLLPLGLKTQLYSQENQGSMNFNYIKTEVAFKVF